MRACPRETAIVRSAVYSFFKGGWLRFSRTLRATKPQPLHIDEQFLRSETNPQELVSLGERSKKMKKNHLTKFLIIAITLTAGCFEMANAQLNEKRVQRKASGVYEGQVTGITRVRLVPNHEPETITYEDIQGKMKVPVTEKKVRSNVSDEQLAGSGAGKVQANGKKAKVKKGGKKIKYKVNRGSFDIPDDDHNPITNGSSKGNLVQRGKTWTAVFTSNGQRLDNDGYTSLFSAFQQGSN